MPLGPGVGPGESARLVFAVTAHGLGHLTRCCELANAIHALRPDIEVHFWTELPRDRIASDLEIPFAYRAREYEPGTAQRSCFEVDREATIRDYARYLTERETRLAEERATLIADGCDAVISDAPALVVRAAAELGLPVIAVSNFTWDWLLEPILMGTPAEAAIDLLRSDYRQGTKHLQLPFGPSESPFESTSQGPLISRRARLEAADVRRRLGLGSAGDRPVALVCPGGWDADGWERVSPDTMQFDLILVGDLPVDVRSSDVALSHALAAPIRFPDLVAAADVVLAKPGYGIASECIVHRTPLVTIDRPGFRETPLLRAELAESGPCAEISLPDFFEGRWSTALEQALGCATPWVTLPEHPDRVLAEQALDALGWSAER